MAKTKAPVTKLTAMAAWKAERAAKAAEQQ